MCVGTQLPVVRGWNDRRGEQARHLDGAEVEAQGESAHEDNVALQFPVDLRGGDGAEAFSKFEG